MVGTERFGRLAQLGERRVRNAEVAGSSPAPSTRISIFYRRGIQGLRWRQLDCQTIIFLNNAKGSGDFRAKGFPP